MGSVVYTTMAACGVSDDQLQACAQLFSSQYGTWGHLGPKPGARVKLSAAKLREQCLFDRDTCFLVTAKIGGVLVGHAFSTTFWYEPGGGCVSWITQLCVSAEHRSRGIASRLCRHSWAIDATFACGLVTSHPHAVRAVERATGRLCNPTISMQHADRMISASGIPYMQSRTVARPASPGGCTIDTGFFVDHTEVNRLISAQPNWHLGDLPEGHEFFAFTFPAATPSRRVQVATKAATKQTDQ
mmetsp:Transcript_7534/g.18680  ORF Transcript_7534/g.18680 Transcript_7534/m.18680 type:complete len:243 (-) Transcript_7534:306-1034(-)